MTLFEEILKEIGAVFGSEAEQQASELVNEFIFSDQEYTDEEIKKRRCGLFQKHLATKKPLFAHSRRNRFKIWLL